MSCVCLQLQITKLIYICNDDIMELKYYDIKTKSVFRTLSNIEGDTFCENG